MLFNSKLVILLSSCILLITIRSSLCRSASIPRSVFNVPSFSSCSSSVCSICLRLEVSTSFIERMLGQNTPKSSSVTVDIMSVYHPLTTSSTVVLASSLRTRANFAFVSNGFSLLLGIETKKIIYFSNRIETSKSIFNRNRNKLYYK
uniref:Secreted protein n=1 Tax=Cacopsylla melanoneura TaxID=428564 RepID=A0A8D9C039_9HEMI